jgi:hypothetical protein
VGNIDVYFGGTGTSGLVMSNGKVQSLDMTITSSISAAGFSFNTSNLRITANASNNVYTITGNSSISATNIGNIDVQWGKSNGSTTLSRGMVITSGSLTTLDMTVNSNISVSGLGFSTRNLNLSYTASSGTNAAKFVMTGNTTANIGSIGWVSVGFGSSTRSGTTTQGLVLSGGSLTSLDMNVRANMTAGGLSFTADNLRFIYQSSSNYFQMTGSTSVTVPSIGSVNTTFGSSTSNGLVVTNGQLTSLDMTVNSNLSVGGVSII